MLAEYDRLGEQLESGSEQLSLTLTPQVRDRLIDYVQLLHKWNAVYNLSGIKEPSRMVALHLLDSLSVVPYLSGDVVLDVGTGAGLPGIPLALYYPEKKFLLLDSNGKKTRFLFQASTELKLGNIEIFHVRAQDFQCRQQIDIVLSRAFASLATFVGEVRHLLGQYSRLLAMKGQYPEDEIVDLPEPFKVFQSHALKVPGVEGLRHLIDIRTAIV